MTLIKISIVSISILSIWLATEPKIREFIVLKILRWRQKEYWHLPVVPQLETDTRGIRRYGAGIPVTKFELMHNPGIIDLYKKSQAAELVDALIKDNMIEWDEEEDFMRDCIIIKGQLLVAEPFNRGL